MIEYAWLVPLLPLLAFVLIEATASYLGDKVAWLGVGAILASFVVAVKIFVESLGGAKLEGLDFNWVLSGDRVIPIGIQVDHLAAVTMVMVTIVSAMVQLYSIGYMHGDKRFGRYFAVVSLFTAAMLGLVIADNFFLLLLSWEIMGLCSYLLIGHWYENTVPQEASMKAFLTTRVGDIGLMIGIWVLFAATGSFNFAQIGEAAKAGHVAPVVLLIGGLLVFSGGVGKSAQFPLHVWLPDAMAGPTPASALIHAATMVAAGVYLVARSYMIFAYAPAMVLMIVAIIGGFTAFFAATIATVRTDIKQVLAYSTVSQLGYMMLALGVGGATAGAFHLTTHAFFKALLFLGSGSVIHAVHSQEMHELGGLYKKMPITFGTWVVGTLALSGVPPFSGFFSKDEILLAAYNYAPRGFEWVGGLVFAFGMATAFLTAYYMTRATVLTFFGRPRNHHQYDHAHESPWVMALPLVILAVPALLVGFAGSTWFGLGNWFGHFVEIEGGREFHHSAFVQNFAIISALGGILVGYLVYGRASAEARSRVLPTLRPVYLVLKNKYYVDEFYHATAVAGTLALSRLAGWFDQNVIDRLVNWVGALGVFGSDAAGETDRVVVDGLVNFVGDGTLWVGRQARRLQTGLVQSYMLTLAAAVVIGIILFQVIGG